MAIDVELKTIKIMLAIEQEGSFSKAAEVLYISQPALTQYIKRIESVLSFPLYNRENGKCVPTKAAKILLKEGQLLLEQYDSMLKKMNNTVDSKVVNIQLGWPTGYTVQYLNSIMSSISNLESINVKVTENLVETLIQLLLQKKLNVLIIPALYFHPDLVYTTIRREEFYLAVPKNHVANTIINKDRPTDYANLSDLKDMPFISLSANAYKKFIDPLFHEAGYNPNIIFNCTNWYSSHSLVEDGLGLSIVPYWFAEKGHEKINYYHIQSKQRAYRILACVFHRDQLVSPELKGFIDHIKNIYGDQYAHLPFDYSNLNQNI
ncbi:LysR family transcriptional regulator [Ilyobacter polytropus]|uniref:Transcriptional regulator, LysR family n=1 Tax=Ilyobacter polytropus (strain ATCC 51220 / DSM 2926 / LMG 16218 / CuHBu1) TaxID=572544 RepID=E3H688_ILYPC|nr:LysR family transcriptional regulator [Ilyobacter polytropus]ADO81847.1 transcriptional regulator, LysR family [Ilyobacter polytropus DSM 2926]